MFRWISAMKRVMCRHNQPYEPSRSLVEQGEKHTSYASGIDGNEKHQTALNLDKRSQQYTFSKELPLIGLSLELGVIIYGPTINSSIDRTRLQRSSVHRRSFEWHPLDRSTRCARRRWRHTSISRVKQCSSDRKEIRPGANLRRFKPSKQVRSIAVCTDTFVILARAKADLTISPGNDQSVGMTMRVMRKSFGD